MKFSPRDPSRPKDPSTTAGYWAESVGGKARDGESPLPAAARLTDLPLHWLLLTLLLCVAVSAIGQRVEHEHLKQTVKDSEVLTEEEQGTLDDAELLLRKREEISRRYREFRDYERRFRGEESGKETGTKGESSQPASGEEEDGEEGGEGAETPGFDELPMTAESLREYVRERTGENWEAWRKTATVVALVFGGLALILQALLVRALGAATLGAAGWIASYFAGLDPLYVWAIAAAAALVGFFGAPRMLLASVYSNAAIAGLLLGGIAAGGALYLGTQKEMVALVGMGCGGVAGALLSLKFARQMYLSFVVANAAGVATSVLWLCWGEAFEYFWPVTFGGLMIFDGVVTRIYHKVRWA